MHTLHTLVDVSLLFFLLVNSTFVKCMFSRYKCVFFVMCLSTILLLS